MEHKLITGGHEFLPFARSCITKLKKLGLPYADQSYEVGGVSIKVRIEPGHEYIRIDGARGDVYMLVTIQTRSDVEGHVQVEPDENGADSIDAEETYTVTKCSMVFKLQTKDSGYMRAAGAELVYSGSTDFVHAYTLSGHNNPLIGGWNNRACTIKGSNKFGALSGISIYDKKLLMWHNYADREFNLVALPEDQVPEPEGIDPFEYWSYPVEFSTHTLDSSVKCYSTVKYGDCQFEYQRTSKLSATHTYGTNEQTVTTTTFTPDGPVTTYSTRYMLDGGGFRTVYETVSGDVLDVNYFIDYYAYPDEGTGPTYYEPCLEWGWSHPTFFEGGTPSWGVRSANSGTSECGDLTFKTVLEGCDAAADADGEKCRNFGYAFTELKDGLTWSRRSVGPRTQGWNYIWDHSVWQPTHMRGRSGKPTSAPIKFGAQAIAANVLVTPIRKNTNVDQNGQLLPDVAPDDRLGGPVFALVALDGTVYGEDRLILSDIRELANNAAAKRMLTGDIAFALFSEQGRDYFSLRPARAQTGDAFTVSFHVDIKHAFSQQVRFTARST